MSIAVTIPTDLEKNLVPAVEVVPNTWNPNRMDTFMRKKLVGSIAKDGFNIPILVRPLEAAKSRPDYKDLKKRGVKWEIVDGEHRWRVGTEDLGMGDLPVVSVGLIDDAQAKAIMVKANALRGEFDSVRLAEIVDGLVRGSSLNAVAEELPYTQERMQAMINLLSVDQSKLEVPETLPPPGDPKKAPSEADEFKAFDGAKMTFEHKCPRCAFEFDGPAKKAEPAAELPPAEG